MILIYSLLLQSFLPAWSSLVEFRDSMKARAELDAGIFTLAEDLSEIFSQILSVNSALSALRHSCAEVGLTGVGVASLQSAAAALLLEQEAHLLAVHAKIATCAGCQLIEPQRQVPGDCALPGDLLWPPGPYALRDWETYAGFEIHISQSARAEWFYSNPEVRAL